MLCRLGGINKMNKQRFLLKDNKDRYHAAPERKGFFAFVFPYVDERLLSFEDDDIKYTKNGFIKREFKKDSYKKFVAYDGLIWTHIRPNNDSEIIANPSYNWYKVSVKNFIKSIKKDFNDTNGFLKSYKDFEHVGDLKNPYLNYSLTQFEVFLTRDTKFK